MKTQIFFIIFFLITICASSQNESIFPESWSVNEPSKDNPYGKSNSNAIPQLKDYDKLIGICACKSTRLQPDGKWSDSIALKWRWKYIMNGNGVQDEGWYGDKNNVSYFTSIRVYDQVNKTWYVTYFSPNLNNEPDTWTGGVKSGNIILKGNIKTPTGDIPSILTFSNISEKGFDWEGKILSSEEDTTGNSFWKIHCKKIGSK
ncbi:hypothetical protein GTQ40_12130 [Flavobacteriaceae bacterium R38]|nr:hypothetical protein [Flavobacteriaceae bacterium R38]